MLHNSSTRYCVEILRATEQQCLLRVQTRLYSYLQCFVLNVGPISQLAPIVN